MSGTPIVATPFAFRAKPTLFVKELFVVASARGNGDGEKLMRAAASEVVRRGCGVVQWQVARWNESAARFYARLGAETNREWVDYSLDVAGLKRLSER